MNLGEGSYGRVIRQGDFAVKIFDDIRYLTREYAAFQILKGAKNVIQAVSVDYRSLELKMILYDKTLRGWIQHKNNRIDYNMAKVIGTKIAKGLAEIHFRGLTHGDLKPSNILVNLDPFKLVIADLGSVLPNKYSACCNTSATYKDPIIVNGPEHDIFSFGIILIELFSGYRNIELPTYEKMQEIITKYFDGKWARLLSLMLGKNREARPKIEQVYQFLKDESLELTIPDYISGFKPEKTVYIKRYYTKVPRQYKVYTATILYLKQNRIPSSIHEDYHRASAITTTMIFNEWELRYTVEVICKTRVDEDQVLKLGFEMLNDSNYVNIIMCPCFQ